MKKTNILFALLTLLALLLTACGAPATGGGGAATEPPVAPVVTEPPAAATPSLPETATISKDILLDPANATDADSLLIVGYVYEGLVTMNADGIAPSLAESWTVSDDGLDYIFTLRQNVTFQDGAPFNADAVIANFNRWFDQEDPAHGAGEYAAWATIFGGFKGETGADGAPKASYDGAEKVDDYTVLIHLNRTEQNFLAKLNNPAFAMVSPAAFAADYFGTSLGVAAGTGAYKVASWSDTGLTLEPFASYWNGAPTDTMEFQFK
jgi:peptide/nickel transport system substrate-binding protein